MTSYRQPAVFAGHGSPIYAIEPNRFTAAWSALGKTFKRPDAIWINVSREHYKLAKQLRPFNKVKNKLCGYRSL